MTSVPQYTKVLRDTQADIARRLGVDLAYSDKNSRVAAISAMAVQAILIKALVDKGVFTDTDLLTAVNTLRYSPWKPADEPVIPVPWDITPVTGV